MMTGRYLLLTLLVSTLPKLSRCGPRQQWPLTQRTILWEREQRNTENSEFVYGSTCPLLKSDSLLTPADGSFYYDGGYTSVADFGVLVDKDDNRDKYTFTMWLKPDSQTSSGEIFEYKSTIETTNRVTSARGEMVNGKVKFTVARSSGDIGSVTSSVSLDASKFNSVLLSVDDTLRLYVTVNNGPEVYGDLEDWRGDGQSPLQIGGTWRLGEFFERNGPRYVGKINCITFFDNKIGTDKENEFGDDHCTKDWDDQPGSNCLFHLVNLWPLDNVTKGYDVITGSSPLAPQEIIACIRTETCPNTTLSMKNDVLFFDGSLGSAVEMEVNSSVMEDDFTVVVYVRPQQPPEGQVWSYAAHGESDGLSRIEVSLHSNGSLTTTLWGSEGQASCATMEAAGVFDASSDFTRVIVGRSTSAIMLQVGDDVWVDSADSCPKSPGSSGQGSLKVGGRGEGQNAGYRGHVVCMAVFSPYVSTVDDVQLLSQCGDYDPAPYLGAKACNRTTEIRTQRFKQFAQNKAPDVTKFPPMTSFQTSSVARCASRCLRTQHCKSFTFSSGDVTSFCSLFDDVTLTGLGDSKGNYYEITSD